MVDFTPLHTWHIGEENTIEYNLPSGFDEHSSDWIGIYKVTTPLFRLLVNYSNESSEAYFFIDWRVCDLNGMSAAHRLLLKTIVIYLLYFVCDCA